MSGLYVEQHAGWMGRYSGEVKQLLPLLLPGFNMNAEDAAVFAMAQEMMVRVAASAAVWGQRRRGAGRLRRRRGNVRLFSSWRRLQLGL